MDEVSHTNGEGRRGRLIVQVIGFAIGLAMLAWAGRLALSPENRQSLERLGASAWHEVLGLVGLALCVLWVNGLLFAVAIRPVKRLPVEDVQAVNAIASLLSYLPFKLSLVFRTLVHNRRDGVPMFTIGAWLGVVGVLMLCVQGPVILASAVTRDVGALWLGMSIAGIGAAALAAQRLASMFGGGDGLERLRRIVDRLGARPLSAFVRGATFARMHAGVVMLASPRVVVLSVGLRGAELGVHMARFWLAGQMLGVSLAWEEALLVGLVYAFLNAASPAGSLGVADMGAVGVAAWISLSESREEAARFAGIALTVRASEVVAYLIGSSAGVLWLNPMRLARLSRERPAGLDADPASDESVARDAGEGRARSGARSTMRHADCPGTVEPDDRRDRRQCGGDIPGG